MIINLEMKTMNSSFLQQNIDEFPKQDTKAQTITKRTNKFYKKNLCITRDHNKLKKTSHKREKT